MNKPELEALLERVRAATGPDRKLDAAIMEAFGFQVTRAPLRRNATGWAFLDNGRWNRIPELTASIDACLALIERVLPDFQEARLQLSLPLGQYCNASLFLDTFTQEPEETFHGAGRTPALALIEALIEALISTSEASNDQ